MKRLFAIFVALCVAFVAVAQSENSIIIDQNSFRPLQSDALTGFNIDPIGVDSSRRPCARIKMKIKKMNREDIDKLDVKIITNNQLTKCKTADYETGLILEMTAKPATRFYFEHPEFGQSNEVTLNLDPDKEYYMEASLNQTFSIIVESNAKGAEIYLDGVFKNRIGDNLRCTLSEVMIGSHTLKVVYGSVSSEQKIDVNKDAIFFRQNVDNYRIGDIVTIDGVQGVVYQTNPHINIISTATCPKKWKYGKNFDGIISKSLGKTNMAIVQRIKNWYKKYPAFKWCSDLGDNWYIPARWEAQAIYREREKINQALKSLHMGELVLKDSYFVTSDEVDADIAYGYGSYCTLNRCKKTIRAILCLRKTRLATSSPYKIGDYYNEAGKEGVVFEVSADGKHGKIISIDEIRSHWGPEYNSDMTGATDRNDGELNLYKIKDIREYPAFEWCADLGNGWYLPSINELQSIYKQVNKINQTLKANNIGILAFTCNPENGEYLTSSTEVDKSNRYILNLKTGGICKYGKAWNTTAVRAVAKF